MTERFANESATTLDAAITAVATTFVVASSAGFPAPNFRIRIDNEIMLVTGVAGTSWTALRAQEGTTAAAHPILSVVSHILTAGGLAQAISEASQNGLAIGTSGALSTTSAAFVDMTDMSVTLNTTGGDLLVWFASICFHSSASGAITVGVQLDAGAVVGSLTQQPSGTNEIPSSLCTFTRFTGVPAGPHTVKGKWNTATGATANVLANQRELMVVEL